MPHLRILLIAFLEREGAEGAREKPGSAALAHEHPDGRANPPLSAQRQGPVTFLVHRTMFPPTEPPNLGEDKDIFN